MPEVGPFEVTPDQVGGLSGAAFVQVVGQLLRADLAASSSPDAMLDITQRENVADGGVDARTRRASVTPRVPAGDTAWQFKAGDLPPAAAAKELADATEALEILRGGGKYRLVLGVSLTPQQLSRRRIALEDKARELELAVKDGTIEVLGADALAAWLEHYPALAVSPMVGGHGVVGQSFDAWSGSGRHTTSYVSSAGRDQQIETVRTFLAGADVDLHLEGVSGLGKTRLVMEAVRGLLVEPLVVYVPAADSFPPTYLFYLQTTNRRAVLVIDECDAAQHETYAALLPADTSIKLVTISEPSARSTRSPMLGITPLENDALRELLARNEPALWAEAIRVVAEVASGNVDYALKAAKVVLARRTSSASSLVDPADLRQFIIEELPSGALFLASCVLALFDRVGFDGDVRYELEDIARLSGVPIADLRAAAVALSGKGLLSRQGRYRSVGPSPVAIYLATQGWRELGAVIAEAMLPHLNDDLTERLFRRASELGDEALLQEALDVMLGEQGPLGSLEALGDSRNERLLQHLAVLAPTRVSGRLHDLFADASEEDLRSRSSIRRTLIWALSKLAWHPATFADAADDLLRLALAENESYTNNSTGMWIDLFGTRLPATAARPVDRLDYLEHRAVSKDARVRTLSIRAASRALAASESIIASAELQGGAIVDARGAPTTWDEFSGYRNGALDVIRGLLSDDDASVAGAALVALAEVIHPALDDSGLRTHFTGVLGGLSGEQQRAVRMKLQSSVRLFERVGDEEGRASTLKELLAALPSEDPQERLWAALRISPWDRVEGDDPIRDALSSLPDIDVAATLLGALAEPLPAAFDVGVLLASIPDEGGAIASALAPCIRQENSAAVFGYLRERVARGASSAFDDFARYYDGDDLSLLALSTRGPRSEAAVERVRRLIGEVPVAVGARQLFPWVGESGPGEVADFLASWLDRIETQQDYNAVIDLAALYINKHGVDDSLQEPLRAVVSRRAEYPNLGQQTWDWGRLASKLLQSDPGGVVELMLSMISSDTITAFSSSPDGELLREAISAAGDDVWRRTMDQLLDPDSWRLSFSARDWLAHAAPLEVAQDWVGHSVERARVLASVTTPGRGEVTSVARFLLDQFGEDERVASALSGAYVSGAWTGNESDRIHRQIAELQRWIGHQGQPEGVRRWARQMIEHLHRSLRAALEREAERGW